MIDARFGHVNVIARDWRRLEEFYREVFGMEIVPPLRDYRGPDVEAGTGVVGAAFRGAHLRLPGLGPDGPTLEIYQYESGPDGGIQAANRPGTSTSPSPCPMCPRPARPFSRRAAGRSGRS